MGDKLGRKATGDVVPVDERYRRHPVRQPLMGVLLRLVDAVKADIVVEHNAICKIGGLGHRPCPRRSRGES